VPPGPAQRRAAARVAATTTRHAARLGLGATDYLAGRLGTAATLRALDAEHGGGFFAVPPEAESDRAATDECFAAQGPVVDVQTHLVRPSRATTAGAEALMGFLRMVEPERWAPPIDVAMLSAPAWASCVFGGSETSVALLTSPPGVEGRGVIDNGDIAAAREVVDRYAGSGRVLTHSIVHPNLGEPELERMGEWSAGLGPSGWKVYTLWDPPGGPTGGWYLDDETGEAFLDRVSELGPRVVCAHKGLAGPNPSTTPAAASPRDVGPAARAHPDIELVVYHSGYDIDATSEEGPHDADPKRGVSRLVSSLAAAGVGPGANVWAELGSTWSLVLRRPVEAAHVIGKLLLAVGEDRVLWGTDSVWYGPPQPLIDAFRAFTIPERLRDEFGYPELTPEVKQKILGGNAARLYGIDPVPRRPDELAWIDEVRTELAARLP
jgi:uncharacterized protein